MDNNFIRQTVDCWVGGLDPALQDRPFGGSLGGGEILVEGGHALDQGDHAVMTLDAGGVGKVDGMNREIL